MKKKKWLERFKLRGKSVMIPMVILMILTALVPMLLQAMISRRAFNQTQLEAKGIEIQNQCLILSSRLREIPWSWIPVCRRSQIFITGGS